MIRKRVVGDLNVAYRPYRLDEVFGNERIKNMVSGFLLNNTLPHANMFIGNAGCGKTTMARIIALGLNCETGITPNPCCECPTCKSIINQNSLSVMELDGARTGNVDTIKRVLSDLPSAPFGMDRCRVLILDEAHRLSGAAEDALLKFLEDTPQHVYVILCTNQPLKLQEVTRQRCKPIQFSRMDDGTIATMLEEVAQFEGMPYTAEIIHMISEECEGTPRIALSYLQQVAAEGSWTKESTTFILSAGVIEADQQEVIELCRKLLTSTKWYPIQDMYLQLVKKIPPETMRIAMMGFMAGCFKNAKSNDEAILYHNCTEILSTLYYGPNPQHILLMRIFKCYSLMKGVPMDRWV